MIAGACFAAAGLWLMFRPKPEGQAAKIEFLGMKFESSSAGLLVFLIGAAFLASPAVIPETESNAPNALPPGVPTGAEAQAGPGAPAPMADETDAALPLPRRADLEEIEDNGSISDSNAIWIGQTVRGELGPEDLDWYVFAADAASSELLRVTFRNLGGGCPQYALLDAAENQVNYEQVCEYQISHTRDYFVESDRYYLRVAGNRRTEYEIAISYP
jgi:hypothetical protein